MFVILRFVSLIFYTTYDTTCIVFEHASVIDCHQEVIIPDQAPWTLVWIVLSVISSVLFVFIVVDNMELLNFQKKKAKKLFTKGSFISLLILLGLTTMYYIIRTIIAPSSLGRAISIVACFSPSARVIVLIFFNYTPRVRLRPIDGRSESCCRSCCCQFLAKYMLFFFYWIALVMCFLEIACVWVAVALDTAHEVAPLIQKEFPDESSRYKGVLILLLGFSLAFHSRMLSFFWQKLFHGDKDLFSEPCGKLVNDQIGPTNTEGPPVSCTSGNSETQLKTATVNLEGAHAATSTKPEGPLPLGLSSGLAGAVETKSTASTSKNELKESNPQVVMLGSEQRQETEKLLQN